MALTDPDQFKQNTYRTPQITLHYHKLDKADQFKMRLDKADARRKHRDRDANFVGTNRIIYAFNDHHHTIMLCLMYREA